MHTLSHLDPELFARALKKQADTVDRIIAALTGEWERGWSRTWRVHPRISVDEVLEDLRHGRD